MNMKKRNASTDNFNYLPWLITYSWSRPSTNIFVRTTIATKWVSLQEYFTNLNWENRRDVEWTGGASISLSASCPLLSCEYGWKLVSWLDKGRSIWNLWSESLVQWLTWKEVARAVYVEDINNKVKYNLNPLCCRKTMLDIKSKAYLDFPVLSKKNSTLN